VKKDKVGTQNTLEHRRKGKEEYLYSTILYTMYISKHTGMDHTVLLAIHHVCLSFNDEIRACV